MTADAITRRPLEDVVHVTRGARLLRVNPDQRKDCVVIEIHSLEARVCRAMTGFTRGPKAGRDVIRRGRAFVVGAVAPHAVARRPDVDAVLVA